ncbi:MAG: metallophosphoesterase [Bacteroidales bacterium]|nr:metallophosphoesterase [Bacteroidales bacterium]
MATSDLHGCLDGLDDYIDWADVVVIAGDVEPCEIGSDPIAFLFDDFFAMCERHSDKTFVMTPGNHDFTLEKAIRRRELDFIVESVPGNLKILVDGRFDIGGVLFWGSPWVPNIDGRWAFESRSLEELDIAEKFLMIPDNVDVLVTHSPPYVANSNVDVSIQRRSSPHFGSLSLVEAIIRKRPALTICGHIHSGQHGGVRLGKDGFVISDGEAFTTEDEVSTVFNVSRLDEKYRISYRPTMIEYEKDGSSRSWRLSSLESLS